MATLLVVYGASRDSAKFDAYYRGTHVPLAEKLPGLRGVTVSKSTPVALAGEAVELVALLKFDSVAAIQAALASPEGAATAGDIGNFADGGVRIIAFEDDILA